MATTPIGRLSKYLELVRKHPRRKRVFCIGDSWFQYPLRRLGDLQNLTAAGLSGKAEFLDDSWPGRDAEEVFGLIGRWRGIAADLQQRLGKPFDLIMVSLGGNDVIGTDFGRHLKPAGSPEPLLDWPYTATVPSVAHDHIRFDRLRATFDVVAGAYRMIRGMRDDFAPLANIVSHTYADVIPSNTPFQLPGLKAGPWMWEKMREVGLRHPIPQRELSRWLLESFEGLMSDLAAERPGFIVLSTRGSLSAGSFWDNEIHPTRNGYRQLVDAHWLPTVRKALGLA